MAISYHTPRTGSVKAYSKRLLGVLVLMFYVQIFSYFYTEYIFPKWAYFGFRLDVSDPNPYWTSVLCILVAYFFTPINAPKASDYILTLLFVLAFVPIQLTVGLSNSVPDVTMTYQLSLLASFALSALLAKGAGRIRWLPRSTAVSRQSANAPSGNGHFKRSFLIVSGLTVAVLLVKFRSILNFAGIEDIYEQRAAANDFGINSIFGYLILWTTYLLAPLTLALALVTKSRSMLIMAAIMMLAIYLITAAKVMFVTFGFCLAIHVLNRFNLRENMYFLFILPVAPILVAISFSFSTDTQVGALLSFVVDQIVIRGIAIQAMTFNLFIEYFSYNPLTYYSHVTGISFLIDYPYDLPVGRVVGEYQYGTATVNANSGIWATDGVAAAGSFGVLLIGVFLGAFLGFANRVTRTVGHDFLSVALVPLVLLMVNASMFTTLASGGGIFLVLVTKRLWRDISLGPA